MPPPSSAPLPAKPDESASVAGWRTRCRPEWLAQRKATFTAMRDSLGVDEATTKLAWDILYRSYQKLDESVFHGVSVRLAVVLDIM